jgi:hypothetical protein
MMEAPQIKAEPVKAGYDKYINSMTTAPPAGEGQYEQFEGNGDRQEYNGGATEQQGEQQQQYEEQQYDDDN